MRKKLGPRAPVAMLAVTAVGVHLVPGFLLVHAFYIGLFGIDLGAGAAYPSSHDVSRARVEVDLSAVIIGVSVAAVVVLAALQRRHPPLARAVLAVEALIAGAVFSFFFFLVRVNFAHVAG
jgi:hypothetical protein